jgi:hypothetical protein
VSYILRVSKALEDDSRRYRCFTGWCGRLAVVLEVCQQRILNALVAAIACAVSERIVSWFSRVSQAV